MVNSRQVIRKIYNKLNRRTETVFCLLILTIIVSWTIDKKESDLKREKLKGNVKSITERYEVVNIDRFGKAEIGKDSVKKSLTMKKIVFDSNGNKIEWRSINYDGSVDFIRKYKYDTFGNLKEWISHNSDGSIQFKEAYKCALTTWVE